MSLLKLKMGKVISLVDRLREKNNQVEYAQGRYPLFEGKVIAVSARVIESGQITSIVNYLPSGQVYPEQNLALRLLLQNGKKEYEERWKKLIQSVSVPFSVDPAIVNDTNVKGYITDIYGISAYVLEVLRNENRPEGAGNSAISADYNVDAKYAGFKYIVPL